jgi:hypothetical protein
MLVLRDNSIRILYVPFVRDNSNVFLAYVVCKVLLRIGSSVEKPFPQRYRLEEDLYPFRGKASPRMTS